MNDWFEAEKIIERAHELYESGRLEEALVAYNEAISVNPYQPEWHCSMALTLEAMDRQEDAYQSYNNAIEIGGASVDILNALGAVCLRLSRFKEAIRQYEAVEQLDANDISSYCGRIAAYSHLNDYDAADAMFYMALSINEENARAWYNIAESLLDREELDRSIYCFRQALKFDPRDDQIFAKLAHVFWLKGDLEQSYRHFLEQLRRAPGDVDTLLDMGNLLVEMKRPIEAAEKYRRAAELEPSNAEAHFHLGQLVMKASHLDAAQMAFERTLALNPERPLTRKMLANIAVRRKHLSEARDLMSQELDLGEIFMIPNQARELGQLAIDIQAPEIAVRVFRRLTRINKGHAGIQLELGVALLMRGDTFEGLRHCRRAIKLNPKLSYGYYNLALGNLQMGNNHRAMYWVQRGLERDPRNRRLSNTRSYARLAILRGRVRRFLDRFGKSHWV